MDIKGKANKLLSFALAIIMVLGTLVGYVPAGKLKSVQENWIPSFENCHKAEKK